MELTREHIVYHIKGMEMALTYLRDALMCTFMDIPVRYFFELNGNLPLHFQDRMTFLEKYTVTAEKVKLMCAVKSLIFNTNDKELGEKYCALDLLLWQNTILLSHFAEKEKALVHIGEIVSELLQYVYFLKTEMLHKDFFDFDRFAKAEMELLLEEVAAEKAKQESSADKYAGWHQLEAASDKSKECCNKADLENNAIAKEFKGGEFSMVSPISKESIHEVFQYLQDFKINSGADYGKSIIDVGSITSEDFEHAVRTGSYGKLFGHCRMKKLYFFICCYSKAYIQDWKSYRDIAAASLQTSRKNLESYSKDPDFAKGLQTILPLLKFNNT